MRAGRARRGQFGPRPVPPPPGAVGPGDGQASRPVRTHLAVPKAQLGRARRGAPSGRGKRRGREGSLGAGRGLTEWQRSGQ